VIRKIGNALIPTNVLYDHAEFGGNRTTHVGVRGQRLIFFTLSRFYRLTVSVTYSWVNLTRDKVGILYRLI